MSPFPKLAHEAEEIHEKIREMMVKGHHGHHGHGPSSQGHHRHHHGGPNVAIGIIGIIFTSIVLIVFIVLMHNLIKTKLKYKRANAPCNGNCLCQGASSAHPPPPPTPTEENTPPPYVAPAKGEEEQTRLLEE